MSMTLPQALNPELVICARCLGATENKRWWAALANEDDGALLVRDVCAAPNCPELQVRGHFCRRHCLDFESSWRALYPVRVCHVCRIDALDLYRDKLEVWFVVAQSAESLRARGMEKRRRIKSEDDLGDLQDRAKKPPTAAKRQRRRSSRFHRQHIQKEQLRALDWSLGNIVFPKLHLWPDNERRLEVERNPHLLVKAAAPPTPKTRVYPEPTAVFCVVQGCARFAKSGDRCLFHSHDEASTTSHVLAALDSNDSNGSSSNAISMQNYSGGG